MDGLDEGGFKFDAVEPPQHPQYKILRKHIERSIQDIFLESLRNQNVEFLYVFETEEQIDGFIKRTLSYWEKFEKYEICKEIMELSVSLKEKWETREDLRESEAIIRIRDIFGSTFK